MTVMNKRAGVGHTGFLSEPRSGRSTTLPWAFSPTSA